MSPTLNSLAPRTSLPLTVKSPFESIAGRKRCVSKPLPLLAGTALGVLGADWALAELASSAIAATAAVHARPHRAEFRLLRRRNALATRASLTQEPRALATPSPTASALFQHPERALGPKRVPYPLKMCT